MTYEPTRLEIDFVKCLLGSPISGYWTDDLVIEALKQTKIFHFMSAVKLLKTMDNVEWDIPELDEINKKIDQVLEQKKR